MEVKEAVTRAKQYVADLFASEDISNVGLEEVEFDDGSNMWTVTIGFSRPWDKPINPLLAMTEGGPTTRAYKVVTIDDRLGKVKSVKNREMAS
ncbi:MAG: hypothetical protein V1792_29475 [Pseudomonadota bacterium]